MEQAFSIISGKRWSNPGLRTANVLNPATEEIIGTVELIDPAGLDQALAAAARKRAKRCWCRPRPARSAA